MKRVFAASLASLAAILLLAVDQPATAQTELERLAAEKAKAEAEKAKLEVELAILKTQFALMTGAYEPKAKRLEGKGEIKEGVNLPSSILAHHAAKAIAAQVVTNVINSVPESAPIVIYDEREFSDAVASGSTRTEVSRLITRFQDALPPKGVATNEQKSISTSEISAAAIPGVAATMLTAVADVTTLFRTEFQVGSAAPTIARESIVSEVFRSYQEKKKNARLVYPPLFLPREFLTDGAASSALVKQVELLASERARGAAFVANPPPKTRATLIDTVKTLNGAADQLLARIFSPNDKGVLYLTRLIKGELLGKILAEDGSRVLVMEIVTQGGANKTTNNLFTGPKLWHTGGLVVNATMLRTDGAIERSGVFWATTDYVKFKHGEKWRLKTSWDPEKVDMSRNARLIRSGEAIAK